MQSSDRKQLVGKIMNKRSWWDKRLTVRPYMQYFYFMITGQLRCLGCAFLNRRHLRKNDLEFYFIVGSGRSGNTLLRKLLMERASIYIPPESYVIPSAVTGLLKAGSLRWDEKVDFFLSKFEYYPEFETFGIGTLRDFAIEAKSWPKAEHNIGLLLSRLYFWIASEKGLSVKRVGDKTPLNTLRLGLVNRILPKARYIYIERDGVDVAASYLKAGIYKNIVDGAIRWKLSKRAWRSFKKGLNNKCFYEVRYEELVSKPDAVIDELLRSFAIEKQEIHVDMTQLFGDVGTRAHHDNVLNTTHRDSIGKGRAEIASSDRLLLRAAINDELLDSGYEAI